MDFRVFYELLCLRFWCIYYWLPEVIFLIIFSGTNLKSTLFFFFFNSCEQTGKLQQTLAGCIERTGKTLHCGKVSAVKLWPEVAGKGRYFDVRSNLVRASIDLAKESPLCTTLCDGGIKVRTVEHLLSALEAMGVDNCRIEIMNSDPEDYHVEVSTIKCSYHEVGFDGVELLARSSQVKCQYELV